MKDYTVTFKVIFLVGMLSIGMFTSCSDDKKEATGHTGTEIIGLIKRNLYDNTGSVHAIHLYHYQEGEYALIAEKGEEACKFFSALTGTEAPLSESYEYTYEFTNAKGEACKISIKGKSESENGIYATLYFNIPECSELQVLHIADISIMNDSMDGVTAGESDVVWVPVMG